MVNHIKWNVVGSVVRPFGKRRKTIDKCFCVLPMLHTAVRDMKHYSSREVIAILLKDGWYEVNVTGSHRQFKHPTKKGRTTVKHPDKDIPRKTLDSIERQSGLRFR